VIIGRRGFVGGLLSLLASPAVARAASLMPVSAANLGIVLPPWCPPGFVPEVGQMVKAAQLPGLFKKTDWFYPLYFGRKEARLPYNVVRPEPMQGHPRAYSHVDNLTRLPVAKLESRVCVGLVATAPQTSANGRVLRPGWRTNILVSPEDFAKSYPDVGPGPVNQPAVAFDAYEADPWPAPLTPVSAT
jgi:hypothetical protein